MVAAPKIDTKKIKQQLLERRKELEHVMEASAETNTEAELDQQRIGRLSRMDAMQQQAMEEETHRRRDRELARIEAALKRIEGDDYGFCNACDEPIAIKRLENDPATPLCIGCASKAG
ncbi:MAG: TraR/DksA family transcriptional regulator [Rhodospirillaceae bacterium]|jgi:DnaK suppressor protein|nr:TraR/DksA family transcriptional regulator [Rhodospirillaceae bacterium]MBT5459036.1 TraR/DksA family transcriptional regulator [Rhodospirillaceae bacterium]